GARIGTGSPRRMAQLNAYARARGSSVRTVPIRGNVDTRLGFVRSGELDAVVLAAAGLNRVGRSDEVTDFISADTVLPAPGQGALAIECAADDAELIAALAELDDPFTRAAVTAERSLLATLEAGCSAPVGALADLLADGQIVKEMRLRGVVGTTDGSRLVQLSTTGPVPETHEAAMAPGRELATELLAQGAAGLMGERAQGAPPPAPPPRKTGTSPSAAPDPGVRDCCLCAPWRRWPTRMFWSPSTRYSTWCAGTPGRALPRCSRTRTLRVPPRHPFRARARPS